jgi:phosphohistidine phosphatase
MKTLLLLRHAKSSWDDETLPDHERPLNGRGKRAAPLMGKLILKLKLVPEQILSSTAVRARTTAAIVARNSGFKGAIELHRELYDAGVEDIVHVVSEVYHDDSRVLVVGHNPGLEQLLFALTRTDEHLPTAGLAQIDLPLKTWRGLSASSRGTLVHLWRPREVE